MLVVRTVRAGDVEALLALAQETGPGLTSFKPDRDGLLARVARVQRTLDGSAAHAEAGYFFVMEDSASGEIVGVSGIETEVGLVQPFYNYRVSTVVHASADHHVWKRMSLLSISHDLTGNAELCSLFLSPRWRTGGAGGLLSRARFMFIAQFLDRFPERICAELRGYFDEQGQSPFWEAVGSHFYQIDFNDADYLSAHGRKAFLAELTPRYPIYVDLLPQSAQDCVGLTHRDTAPARRMLEAEGLRYQNHVDIFDAGPVLECHIADLHTVRDSVLVPVEIVGRSRSARADAPHALVSTTALAEFRCGLVQGRVSHGAFHLHEADAAALGVRAGDAVRVLPVKRHT